MISESSATRNLIITFNAQQCFKQKKVLQAVFTFQNKSIQLVKLNDLDAANVVVKEPNLHEQKFELF